MSAVEDFLDSLAHPLRAEIDALRALIETAEPALAEHVKWNAPSFTLRGEDCITLKIQPPKSVQVIFHRGAKKRAPEDFHHLDPDGMLKWAAPDRAVASFRTLAEIDAGAETLTAFVRRWTSIAAP